MKCVVWKYVLCVTRCGCWTCAEPWASCSCWSRSSFATWSSATSLWSAASSSTCCSSVLYLCGLSTSSWPAGSTSDCATASAAVSEVLARCHAHDPERVRFPTLLHARSALENYIGHRSVLMLPRDGGCPRVVVGLRMHALHGAKELSAVRERECNSGSQPQLWDRLPLWLDLLWEIWSSWGKRNWLKTRSFPFLTWGTVDFHSSLLQLRSCSRVQKCWPRKSWPTCQLSVGCGTSWRSFSVRESGRRIEGRWLGIFKTCMITRRSSG